MGKQTAQTKEVYSREVKHISLRLSEWKYAGADHDGITKYQLKNFKILQYHAIKREEEPKKDVLRTCNILLLKTKTASILLL